MRSGRLRLRVAPRMRSRDVPDVYIYNYRDIIIYRDSASVESTRGGSLTLAPIILCECNALWGERELPRFMFVCMFYMLLIYVQHFSYQDYTKG